MLVIREFDSTTNRDDVDEATGRDVLVVPHPTNTNHNGGQLQFGPDGYLYAATGDGGGGDDPDNNAQNLNSLLGKMLRIDPTGAGPGDHTNPPDNPFAGATPGADEIYAYGLRNPYRFSFDRLTGDLTIGDVGQGALEEVDFMTEGTGLGANFGWDCFEGTMAGGSSGQPQCNPLQGVHTPPVLEYARPATGAAVNGGFVVRDETVPSLLGRYVYGDSSGALPGNAIFSALLFAGGSSENGPTGLSAPFVVSFGEDACGHVYVVSGSGQVSRIAPVGASGACSPQTALDSPPLGDTTPPTLSVDVSKARRAANRGAVRLVVGCDESCVVSGEGEVAKKGKDLGLDPGSEQLAAGVPEALDLELSGREARRLRSALKRGSKARAVVDLLANDATGNQTAASRRIKQNR